MEEVIAIIKFLKKLLYIINESFINLKCVFLSSSYTVSILVVVNNILFYKNNCNSIKNIINKLFF